MEIPPAPGPKSLWHNSGAGLSTGSHFQSARDHGAIAAECQLTAEDANGAEGFRGWR